jgi:hypothetical protein
LTQFCKAKSTFSCITNLTESTFFDTAANLSISATLSYFSATFCNILPYDLSRALSLAVVALSAAFGPNYVLN